MIDDQGVSLRKHFSFVNYINNCPTCAILHARKHFFLNKKFITLKWTTDFLCGLMF